LSCEKGTRQCAQCGRTAYATPSENKRGGLSCRRQEQQQQSTGQNACGIATTNAGCRRRGKERRHQRAEVSKDEREWGKKRFEDLDQRRMGRPVARTWSTDFLLREGLSREEIGKWLRNKPMLWQRRRKLLQVVTGTFPCGTVNKEFLAIDFKRTRDARSNYVERATVVAQEQYTSLLMGLQAVGVSGTLFVRS
jgi:hypothetical protein